jgi:hypothetical protein
VYLAAISRAILSQRLTAGRLCSFFSLKLRRRTTPRKSFLKSAYKINLGVNLTRNFTLISNSVKKAAEKIIQTKVINKRRDPEIL